MRIYLILYIVLHVQYAFSVENFNRNLHEMENAIKDPNLSRIKDITSFEGIRENTLTGYGLVIGLNGTGDNVKNSIATQRGYEDFLSKFGISARESNIKTKNIAAVAVTAKLHPFAHHGQKIDVDIGAIGDAKSLEGGILMNTPLLGADGALYAVANGRLEVHANQKKKTTGMIADGGTVEREVNFNLNNMKSINISLRSGDISTAHRIANAINEGIEGGYARSIDSSTVQLRVPDEYSGRVLEFLSMVEVVEVIPDAIARIVIDRESGTIAINKDVRISTIALSRDNLNLKIGSGMYENITTIERGASLKELVDGLNALGVKVNDLAHILQSIKSAGAMHADIIVR